LVWLLDDRVVDEIAREGGCKPQQAWEARRGRQQS
jgi:hypothetical protein